MLKIFRKMLARYYKVPFPKKEWYNYRAMLGTDVSGKTFIESFDDNNKYILPPKKGEEVIYNVKGKRYVYIVVGFEDDSPNRDWLFDYDWVNPIIQFKKKL